MTPNTKILKMSVLKGTRPSLVLTKASKEAVRYAYIGVVMLSKAQKLPLNPTREHHHPPQLRQLVSLARVMRFVSGAPEPTLDENDQVGRHTENKAKV